MNWTLCLLSVQLKSFPPPQLPALDPVFPQHLQGGRAGDSARNASLLDDGGGGADDGQNRLGEGDGAPPGHVKGLLSGPGAASAGLPPTPTPQCSVLSAKFVIKGVTRDAMGTAVTTRTLAGSGDGDRLSREAWGMWCVVLHEKNEHEPLWRVRSGRRGQGQGVRAGGCPSSWGQREAGWEEGERREKYGWGGS